MTKTLHFYIAKDLAKVAVMALMAFTLFLTVLSIMEPLRKRGLATDQVIELFTYTLPATVSLTLPVAALFAASIVYGRFAQDNELLACRASGISTFTILKPALVMGVLVTILSLLLSNFITPHLMRLGEIAIRANVRGTVYHALQSQGSFRMGNYVIHADYVDMPNDTLHGVVFVKEPDKNKTPAPGKPEDILVLTAASARVNFDRDSVGDTYVTLDLARVTAGRTGDNKIGFEGFQRPFDKYPMPSFVREKSEFFDFQQLFDTLKNPTRHREMQRELTQIMRSVQADKFANDVARTINDHKPYDKLADAGGRYIIRAAAAAIEMPKDRQEPRVVLSSGLVDGRPQAVEITRIREGMDDEIVESETGTVGAQWIPRNDLVVFIEPRDPKGLRVRFDPGRSTRGDARAAPLASMPAGLSTAPVGAAEWVADAPLPAEIANLPTKVTLEDLYKEPGFYTDNPRILDRVVKLKTVTRPQLLGDITAEMHARVSYSVNCFLLVAMGAALGLIFRGGQLISAFAISAVPAALVIVIMIMGKELIRDTSVMRRYGAMPGLLTIWGGFVVLVIANIVIYWRLLRR